MEKKGSLQQGIRETVMTREQMASAFGLSKEKFKCEEGQLIEIKKRKMKKFTELIRKAGDNLLEHPRESPQDIKKQRFRITKSDDDKKQAFGWANVSIRSNGEIIEDWQNDIVEPGELENAAYNFVELYREGGEMHERGGAAILIESVVFTDEKMKIMGVPEGTLPVGWWIGFKVLDNDVWEKVKDGTYSMFSIEGEADRIEVEDENS